MSAHFWRLAGAVVIAFVVFLVTWGHLSWLPALWVALCVGAGEFARPYAWAWLRTLKAKVFG